MRLWRLRDRSALPNEEAARGGIPPFEEDDEGSRIQGSEMLIMLCRLLPIPSPSITGLLIPSRENMESRSSPPLPVPE